jgi:predicted metal-dependent hydrolase
VSSELAFAGTPLTLRVSPRARRIHLRIDPRTGAVLLTVPKRTSKRHALAWAAGHRDWIEARLAEIPVVEPIEPGGTLLYRGQTLVIDWAEKRPRRIELAGDCLKVGGPAENLEARILRWLKAEARTILFRESAEIAACADGVRLSRVGIGDPISRWGSCSSSGTIRYSWRLIMAPDFVRRATVAHEVAHLVHLNHGPDFHALVKRLLGADPAPARDWLRREGARLHRIGRRIA